MAPPQTARPNPKRLTKEQHREAQRRAARRGRLRRRLAAAASVLVALAGGYWLVASLGGSPSLPPTGVMAGHPETFPPRPVMSEPIDERVQSHVIEHSSHAPGARPGVIISYNCDRFACEPELVDRLSRIVERYPDGVYLAPYPRMPTRIALTTLGKSETLDELDETRISAFIAQRG